eukprot:38911_1
MNNINAPTTTYNNAPIPPVIKNYDKNERNIPTLTPNATISKASTSYVINIINTATSNHNINAEVGGVNLLALVQLFQSASTSLTNNVMLPQINVFKYEYTDCVQFTPQTNAINQHNAPTTQVIKNYDKHEGNTTTLTSKA